MRVLLTGGTGFIGSHAVKHFTSCGDDVWVVDKLTYAGDETRLPRDVYIHRFLREDVACQHEMDRYVRMVRPEVIVNFAAETHVDNSIADCVPFMRTNFEGAVTMMTCARKYGALFVQISTDEVYGVPKEDAARGFVPTDPLLPKNPYSTTKSAADMMVFANHNTYGQPYLVFRPSNNFGPNQHEEKFLPKLVKCLVSKPDGSKTDFPLYGDGGQIREWTYAPDTVKIVRDTIVGSLRNRVINVSSGVSLENVEIIERVKRILSSGGKLENPDAIKYVADRPGHDRRYWIQSDASADHFTPFDDALKETVVHYSRRFA